MPYDLCHVSDIIVIAFRIDTLIFNYISLQTSLAWTVIASVILSCALFKNKILNKLSDPFIW